MPSHQDRLVALLDFPQTYTPLTTSRFPYNSRNGA
jgi:hypothetical protein